LPGNFRESEGEVSLSGISTAILEKVIQYFHYKLKFSNSRVPPPDFDIKPEYANELLIAANYLDC
jgi:transcription elongation factor B subunit 1